MKRYARTDTKKKERIKEKETVHLDLMCLKQKLGPRLAQLQNVWLENRQNRARSHHGSIPGRWSQYQRKKPSKIQAEGDWGGGAFALDLGTENKKV